MLVGVQALPESKPEVESIGESSDRENGQIGRW
jgi:hypothetical protein